MLVLYAYLSVSSGCIFLNALKFQDAFKRELLEESLIEGEPDHLLSINGGPGGWFRFNFIGRQTGGHLKTLAEADRHTLEARWFPCSEVLDGDLDYRYDLYKKRLFLESSCFR